MKLQNQKGAIDMMLVAAIAIVLVVGGFVLVRISEDGTETENAVTPPTATDELQNDKISNEDTKTALVIAEWGVQISLRDSDKLDYTYSEKSGSLATLQANYDSSVSPVFRKGSVENADCQSGLSIYRSGMQPELSTQNMQVGDYFYFITGSPAVCDGDLDSSDNQLLNRVIEDLTSDNISLFSESYVHPILGFSVIIPQNWSSRTTDPTEYVQYEQLHINSPDYEYGGDGYGRVISGGSFNIICKDINRGVAGADGQPSVEDILSGNITTPSVYEGVQDAITVSVADTPAVQYIQAYEGPPSLVTEFNFDDVACKVSNSQAVNTVANEYEAFLESIVL